MRIMRACACPFAALAMALTTSCTPAVESQSSSATNPSAWSTNDSGSDASGKGASDKPTRWADIDRLASFRKAAPRARSQHLDGEHDAEVLANEAAAAYPTLGPLRSVEVGAVVVEALYAPNKPDVATYFVMTKQPAPTGTAWEYLVVSRTGEIDRSGAASLCARCHDEAPYDRLFGRPR